MKFLANYSLKKINIKGNPVVEQNPDYKKELFDLIPSLEVIDETNKEGGLVESTIYGDEEDEEEEDDYEDGEKEDIEDEDVSGEDFEDEDEDDEGDEDDEEDDEEQKHKKRPKNKIK